MTQTTPILVLMVAMVALPVALPTAAAQTNTERLIDVQDNTETLIEMVREMDVAGMVADGVDAALDGIRAAIDGMMMTLGDMAAQLDDVADGVDAIRADVDALDGIVAQVDSVADDVATIRANSSEHHQHADNTWRAIQAMAQRQSEMATDIDIMRVEMADMAATLATLAETPAPNTLDQTPEPAMPAVPDDAPAKWLPVTLTQDAGGIGNYTRTVSCDAVADIKSVRLSLMGDIYSAKIDTTSIIVDGVIRVAYGFAVDGEPVLQRGGLPITGVESFDLMGTTLNGILADILYKSTGTCTS